VLSSRWVDLVLVNARVTRKYATAAAVLMVPVCGPALERVRGGGPVDSETG